MNQNRFLRELLSRFLETIKEAKALPTHKTATEGCMSSFYISLPGVSILKKVSQAGLPTNVRVVL
jgi:hypothetical protein